MTGTAAKARRPRLELLRAAIGPDVSMEIDPDEHVALVVDLLEKAAEARQGGRAA